jgi:hypothetical protein
LGQTLPPRPLPRTAIPVAGEYFLDYIARLAKANYLEFGELTVFSTTPPRSCSIPTGGGSTTRSGWRPPRASR